MSRAKDIPRGRNLPKKVVDPDGRQVEMVYGTEGKFDRKLEVVRFDANTSRTVSANYEYDDSGRIESIAARTPDNTALERYVYGYVDNHHQSNPPDSGSLKEFVEDHALDRCTDFTYDWLGRLTEARMTDDATDCDFDENGSADELHRWQYEYDAASNLIESTHNGNTTTYQTNERHELCWTAPGTPSNSCANPPSGADEYDYNQAGDLLDAASRYELSYNERGQTDEIDAGGAPRAQQYAETGQSQRITSGSATFLFSLLGVQVATQPTPGTGDPLSTGTTRYLRGPDGTLLGQRKPNGTTEFFLFDAHPGSVAAVIETDRIGTAQNPVTARFRYDPYGNVIEKAGTSDTPWRYAGAYFERFPDSDPGTQTGLYKMGERFYDPRTGRWTQQDPLDQSSDLRRGNVHMYAGCDPVNRTDTSGMFLEEVYDASGLDTVVDVVTSEPFQFVGGLVAGCVGAGLQTAKYGVYAGVTSLTAAGIGCGLSVATSLTIGYDVTNHIP